MVLGTYVPDHATPHAGICHSFVYRWLIRRGLITGNYPDPLVELNTNMQPARTATSTSRPATSSASGTAPTTSSLRLSWVGNGNQWRAMGPVVLTVTYRTPALVNYP